MAGDVQASGPPADLAPSVAEAALSPAAAVCALCLAAHVQAWFHVSDIPYWSQSCMFVAAWALIFHMLAAVAANACTSKAVEIDEFASIVRSSNAYVQGVCFVASLVLHGACAAVCAGIVALAWRRSPKGAPPAVVCSAGLTVHFFAVRLALVAGWRTLDRRASRLLQALRLAASTVFLAPVLSVLFLGDRIRAIQLGRPSGNPQPWAQAAFFVCSFALVAQTLLAIVVPMIPGGDARLGTKLSGGDVEVTFVHLEHQPAARLGFALLRCLPCVLLGVGVPAVVVSIVTMEGPGDTPRPPLPASLVCTMFLAVQFLLIHILDRPLDGPGGARRRARPPGPREPRGAGARRGAAASLRGGPAAARAVRPLRVPAAAGGGAVRQGRGAPGVGAGRDVRGGGGRHAAAALPRRWDGDSALLATMGAEGAGVVGGCRCRSGGRRGARRRRRSLPDGPGGGGGRAFPHEARLRRQVPPRLEEAGDCQETGCMVRGPHRQASWIVFLRFHSVTPRRLRRERRVFSLMSGYQVSTRSPAREFSCVTGRGPVDQG
ncbi:unnamed protein product [Prorocentrum cordatum]|uniref:Protein RFT1 homolog n=1 Tax=Prorocentrum cordatum TaxID=2364126 RepID=A0ABN9VH25_9DINO|nr:unnamed protein product [Polarella glacialis]